MKYLLYIFILSLLSASSSAMQKEIAAPMFSVNDNGVGKSIGVIVVKDSDDGLSLTPYLNDLPPGKHKFNVHEGIGCGVLFKPDGSRIPGMAAGKAIKKLPSLDVNADGTSVKPVMAPRLKWSDIKSRTLVIQEEQKGKYYGLGITIRAERLAGASRSPRCWESVP